MSFRGVVAFFCLIFSVSAMAQHRPGLEGQRRAASDEYPWIGKINQYNRMFCSAWILEHGLAVTAKHCFTHRGLNQRDVDQSLSSYSLLFGTNQQSVSVKSASIRHIQFDSGANDLVFIVYDPTQTMSIPFQSQVVLDPVPANTPMKLGGFPSPKFRRVISEGCRTTGYRNDFPARPRDPGYEGIFEDTTCGAWYGASGGVLFDVDPSGAVFLYGVVTHTFDVLSDGSLDPSKIQEDAFGSLATTMFSPLRDSHDLSQLRAEIPTLTGSAPENRQNIR